MHNISIGVLGASGYAGRELCHLIAGHPSFELAFATAHGQQGQTFRAGRKTLTFIATEEAPLDKADLIFSALPHGASLPWVKLARSAGARVVDLSSDLRPGNQGKLSDSSCIPYGLTELYRDRIRGAQAIANPGCYPTAILLALYPLIQRQLLEPGSAIPVAAASGVTGAGFTPRPDLLFAEVSEDFRAYAVGNTHRHLLEMKAELEARGAMNDLVFTPHLLPVSRGILTTIVVRTTNDLADPLEPWREAFGAEPFIHLSEMTPALKDVVRTNSVRISVSKAANTHVPTLIITSAVDNLMKGAAGQALQNANLMLGLDEQLGLAA